MKAPLRVHPKNPRYFTDDGKRAVYVTGSHTWSDLQDMGMSDPPAPFDFDAYLNFLQRHSHNFIRLWRWEMPRWRIPRQGRQPAVGVEDLHARTPPSVHGQGSRVDRAHRDMGGTRRRGHSGRPEHKAAAEP